MSEPKVKTTDDVYRFAEQLLSECRSNGAMELHARLDDALQRGSSGLELLGAIRQTIIDNRVLIDRLLGERGSADADQVVHFVDKAYGH